MSKWEELRAIVERDHTNMGMLDGAKTYAGVVLTAMDRLDTVPPTPSREACEAAARALRKTASRIVACGKGTSLPTSPCELEQARAMNEVADYLLRSLHGGGSDNNQTKNEER